VGCVLRVVPLSFLILIVASGGRVMILCVNKLGAGYLPGGLVRYDAIQPSLRDGKAVLAFRLRVLKHPAAFKRRSPTGSCAVCDMFNRVTLVCLGLLVLRAVGEAMGDTTGVRCATLGFGVERLRRKVRIGQRGGVDRIA
jgi:hypothetical protein